MTLEEMERRNGEHKARTGAFYRSRRAVTERGLTLQHDYVRGPVGLMKKKKKGALARSMEPPDTSIASLARRTTDLDRRARLRTVDISVGRR